MGFDGTLRINGDVPLMKALQTAANMEAHKAIVKKYGAELQRTAKRNAVFTKGYATGATKRKITLEMQDGGFAAKVEAGTDYAGYKLVGREEEVVTVKGTRYMNAQPFMKPAFDVVQPKFIADLRRAGIVK